MTNGLTPTKLRAMYEHGYGIAVIMDMTGAPYIEVFTKLRDAGTTLITGGPHDTTRCQHDHTLAAKHASGECQHPVTAKPYTAAERKARALVAA